MSTTTQWYCDVCHDVIKTATDGWVEWISAPNAMPPQLRSLRIVHHLPASPRKSSGGCQYNSSQVRAQGGGTIGDESLDKYLGPSGLMLALSKSADGLPANELFEFLKRLFVPGYERARFHLSDAIAQGVIEPNLPPGYHWDKDIQATLNWATAEGRLP